MLFSYICMAFRKSCYWHFAIDNFQDAEFKFFICFPKYSTSNFNENAY